MNSRAYFQGVTSFNYGRRFRDNPYLYQGPKFAEELLAWYEGWSTGFDITWRKLTLRQRFQIVMSSSKSQLALPARPAPRRRNKRLTTAVRLGDFWRNHSGQPVSQ
jgi:hypothetical protein